MWAHSQSVSYGNKVWTHKYKEQAFNDKTMDEDLTWTALDQAFQDNDKTYKDWKNVNGSIFPYKRVGRELISISLVLSK